MSDTNVLNQNTTGWLFFVKICFVISVLAMATAIVFLPGEIWVKGYMAMGTLLTIASSFMLSKSIRDDFEAKKFVNRLSQARAEQMLKEYDVAA